MRFVVFAMLVACDVAIDTGPEPLAPLPAPAPVKTDRFVDANACAQCHLVGDASPVLHDATGANVSPVGLWRPSMMALAARDPYYLAAFAEERAVGSDPATVDRLCTRCHAPAGSEEASSAATALGFDELVAGTDAPAVLAREGVTCTACHQIGAADLGTDSSFSGGFAIGYERQLFGRYTNPMVSPMQLIVNYTPAAGTHITSSALCGTCHTVIVGSIAEQATYLEWRSSSFVASDIQCTACHVPTVDDTGAAISAPIATYPTGLAPRSPIGKHSFVGGNAYMMSVLADGAAWSNAGVEASELAAGVERELAHLATAAKLSIVDAHREGATAVVTVRVENRTGHKLPTGYPSRRMWLHLTATAGGATVFESGITDATGALVDATGAVLPDQPHRDAIASSAEVQVWEARMVGIDGTPTHRTLAARSYGKDDRILPAGFAPKAADQPRVAVVGVVADASFVAGSDDVTYRIDNAPAGLAVAVELDFQITRPELVDAIEASRTAAAKRFVDLARARPDRPVALGQITTTLP